MRRWRALSHPLARPMAGLLALLLLAAGCGPSQAGPGTTPGGLGKQQVRFTAVIHSIFYAPQYVAQAKGFFADEGLELTASTAQGSDKGVAALLAGTADIALVGPETTVFVHNQDSPVKVKLFAQLTARDGSFLLARAPMPDFDWSQLRGKTVIGWRVGSMPQMVAAATLKQHGLTPGTDVTYISNLAAPAMAGAFQSGQGDFIQVYEPVVSQLEQAGAAHVVAYFGQAYGAVPVTGYVATDRYIEEHPAVIAAYTRAVYRAMRYLRETDPALVAKEVAELFPGTDVDLLAAALGRYRDAGAWQETPVMAPADFAKLQALMVAEGVLAAGKEAPFDAIATNRFAEEAVAAGQ
jgi:NitT/TauT family transport system substrate-binding protein